jgi:hypothetical protein
MNWAALLLALANAPSSLMVWLQTRKLITLGEAQAAVQGLKKHIDDIERGNQARAEVRKRNAGVPQSDSLPNDGFRRD